MKKKKKKKESILKCKTTYDGDLLPCLDLSTTLNASLKCISQKWLHMYKAKSGNVILAAKGSHVDTTKTTCQQQI